MTCAEFLDRFSDYYDGLLPPAVAARYDDHKAECEACMRYSRVLDRSLSLLRDLPEVEPSSDFQARVHYRIQVDDDRELVGFGPMGSAAATRTVALVAVLLAFTAWAPSMARHTLDNGVGALVASPEIAVGNGARSDAGQADEIQMAPFSAGQLSAPSDDVKQLWSYPNAILYEYSSLSARNRWRTDEDGSFVRAVGLE